MGQPMQIYESDGATRVYGGTEFPADIYDCTSCHLADTYTVDSPQIASICMSCHSNSAASAHIQLQTTSDGLEACMVCHGVEREFDVSNVHP